MKRDYANSSLLFAPLFTAFARLALAFSVVNIAVAFAAWLLLHHGTIRVIKLQVQKNFTFDFYNQH